jgi:hypothetical protein
LIISARHAHVIRVCLPALAALLLQPGTAQQLACTCCCVWLALPATRRGCPAVCRCWSHVCISKALSAGQRSGAAMHHPASYHPTILTQCLLCFAFQPLQADRSHIHPHGSSAPCST